MWAAWRATGKEAGFKVGILVAWRRIRKRRGTFGGQPRVYFGNHISVISITSRVSRQHGQVTQASITSQVTSDGAADSSRLICADTTVGSVMLIPPCGRSISALFFALIALANAGILRSA